MAEYLEEVQWVQRECDLTQTAPLHPSLPVSIHDFTLAELSRAARHLRDGKATGPDDLPVEFWKAIVNCTADDVATQHLLDFCNECWRNKTIPDSWRIQNVTMLYKKGDPADPGNYRPVCLLNCAYKVFAVMLLNRLLDAQVDEKVSATQFGFRPKFGTNDALHCARRAIEVAWSQRNGRLFVLALDWRKAFDSINVESMLLALRRFGLPSEFIEMVAAIYERRFFQVRDCGCTSSVREQHSGIVQGCPLSPFLFILVMSVLMHDAYSLLQGSAAKAVAAGRLYDLLYADDTLLMGDAANQVSELAAAVETIGKRFGMSLHWGKTQAMRVRSSGQIRASTGAVIDSSSSLIYLGGLLSDDARMDSEVSRRIGSATVVFRPLQTVWSHAGLPVSTKLEYLQILVISRLLYGLSSAWLVKSQVRRLEGFHARCLRRILRIPPSYVSRVSNASVFAKAKATPLGLQLLRSQLSLLGKVAQAPEGHPLRRHVFVPGSTRPLIGYYIRPKGRPRQDWTNSLFERGAELFRSRARFENELQIRVPKTWRSKAV